MTANGDLGMTVEMSPAIQDNKSVDIFVRKDTLKVVSC